MTEAEIRRLAQNYIDYFVSDKMTKTAEFKAVEQLWRLCRDDCGLAFRVIWVAVNLLEAANTKALAFLGTGPLEDLINFQGETVTGLLIEAARESTNFCVALSCVGRRSISEGAWKALSNTLPEIRARHGNLVH